MLLEEPPFDPGAENEHESEQRSELNVESALVYLVVGQVSYRWVQEVHVKALPITYEFCVSFVSCVLYYNLHEGELGEEAGLPPSPFEPAAGIV